MSKQLIILTETIKNGSDQKYIDTIIKYFYDTSKDKLSYVPCNGVGNVLNDKTKRKIENLKSNYDGESYVIVCVDTDSRQDQDAKKNLEGIEQECYRLNYEFIWFCENIEDVVWKEKVEKGQKSKKAEKFLMSSKNFNFNSLNLKSSFKTSTHSNMLQVLEKYLTKK
jgi:hypothetical protein